MVKWYKFTDKKRPSKYAARIKATKERDEKKVYFEGLWYKEETAAQYRLFDELVKEGNNNG